MKQLEAMKFLRFSKSTVIPNLDLTSRINSLHYEKMIQYFYPFQLITKYRKKLRSSKSISYLITTSFDFGKIENFFKGKGLSYQV